MFPVCPRSHCNNVLFTYMGSRCEDTLFNRLFTGRVQCQRSLCTTSWYTEAQCKHSLEMRAPIHIQTESKLLLSSSCQTEVHIVPSFSSEAFYSKYREQICSLLGQRVVLKTAFHTGNIDDDKQYQMAYTLISSSTEQTATIINSLLTFSLLSTSNIFTSSYPGRAHVMKYDLR